MVQVKNEFFIIEHTADCRTFATLNTESDDSATALVCFDKPFEPLRDITVEVMGGGNAGADLLVTVLRESILKFGPITNFRQTTPAAGTVLLTPR